MAQGLQRGLDAAGRVVTFKAPSADLTAALGPFVSVFLSDVETVSLKSEASHMMFISIVYSHPSTPAFKRAPKYVQSSFAWFWEWVGGGRTRLN